MISCFLVRIRKNVKSFYKNEWAESKIRNLWVQISNNALCLGDELSEQSRVLDGDWIVKCAADRNALTIHNNNSMDAFVWLKPFECFFDFRLWRSWIENGDEEVSYHDAAKLDDSVAGGTRVLLHLKYTLFPFSWSIQSGSDYSYQCLD